MKVVLLHNERLPVIGYGGTERVVWWLAKGLHELGVEVVLACAPGSQCAFATVVTPDFSAPLEPQLPDADVLHFQCSPSREPTRPYLVTIHGNGKAGETFSRNTVFVSQNHAGRHGAECYVHNGLDPEEYRFEETKQSYLVFLAKASWRVKNVRGAIRCARRAGYPLRIVGGSRWLGNHWRGIHWEGMLGGEKKAGIVAGARGLIFPVLWHEPFGIAVVEALVSGTPVVATPFGSLPELVPPHVGFLAKSEAGLIEGLGQLDRFSPRACREWALERFHYRVMARSYLELYERVLAGESLNREPPRAVEGARLLALD